MVEFIIIASRTCPHCGQTVEATLKKVEDVSINTTPWIMFHTFLFELPALSCCNIDAYPTYIQMKTDAQIDDRHFNGKLKVGSEDVPVISDDQTHLRVTRSHKQQLQLEQQLKKQYNLWEREKKDFFKKTYTYFSMHFDEIIDEMDHLEVLDILRTIEDIFLQIAPENRHRFVYKGKNERKLITKWIKKQVKSLAQEESEQVKESLFFLIVDYFIELKLIPQIHYLKWDPNKFEKMIGESLLTYIIVSFPLTSFFSFLKDEALLQLNSKGRLQKEFQQLIEKTQKELSTALNNNMKMQETIENQRKTIADLEDKNGKLTLQNSRLEELIDETREERKLARQDQKINELKAIIEQQQLEIKQLRSQVCEHIEVEDIGEATILPEPKVDPVDFSVLRGKTVAIFGDIQSYEDASDDSFPCKIISCESLKKPNAVGILRNSDILVVLTQHISHSCMWSIKEYGNQHDIPVVYSRHTNVEIVLEQVLKAIK